jgi:hypothetical protein
LSKCAGRRARPRPSTPARPPRPPGRTSPCLRRHNFPKENHVLFRRAERVLSEADAAGTARFLQVEQERGLTGWHESIASDVARWEQAFRGGQPA